MQEANNNNNNLDDELNIGSFSSFANELEASIAAIDQNTDIPSQSSTPTVSTPPPGPAPKEHQNFFLEPCQCEIYQELRRTRLSDYGDNSMAVVTIKEATKGFVDSITMQQSGTFVTYVIEFSRKATRRRYSDFELLVSHLQRVYPYCVIPPIPEKQTLGQIVTSFATNKSKHDPILIQHRIRLFQSFLTNICNHPILSGDHIFHQFIQPTQDWADGITDIESRIPVGGRSSGRRLKIPDPLLTKLEEMNFNYGEAVRMIERGQKRLFKRLKDESACLSDSGAAFNAFSLEYPALSEKMDKTGQCFDAEVVELHGLIRHIEVFNDTIKEISLFTNSISMTLTNLSAKRSELEEFHDHLNEKKNALLQLESSTNFNDSAERIDRVNRAKILIEKLEVQKRRKSEEMNEFTIRVLKDIERVERHFGRLWKRMLKGSAECYLKMHESAIEAWTH